MRKKKLKKILRKAFKNSIIEIEKEYGDILSMDTNKQSNDTLKDTLMLLKEKNQFVLKEIDTLKTDVDSIDEAFKISSKIDDKVSNQESHSYEKESKKIIGEIQSGKINLKEFGMKITNSYLNSFALEEMNENDKAINENKLFYLKNKMFILNYELNKMINTQKNLEQLLFSPKAKSGEIALSIEKNLDLLRDKVELQELIALEYAREADKNVKDIETDESVKKTNEEN